jgi:hypothetical protein
MTASATQFDFGVAAIARQPNQRGQRFIGPESVEQFAIAPRVIGFRPKDFLKVAVHLREGRAAQPRGHLKVKHGQIFQHLPWSGDVVFVVEHLDGVGRAMVELARAGQRMVSAACDTGPPMTR